MPHTGIPEHPADAADQRRTSLRDLCYILFRHKSRMFLFFVIAILGCTVLTLRAKRVYQSEAKLLVRLGRESVSLDPTATTGQIVPITKSRESEIQTELEILRSHRIAEKVVSSLGAATILGNTTGSPASDARPQPEGEAAGTVAKAKGWAGNLLQQTGLRQPMSEQDKALQVLARSTRVLTEKDTSNIISVYYEAGSPALAQKILTETIKVYLNERVAVHSMTGSYAFFSEQCRLLQKQLAEMEQQLKTAVSSAGTSSIEEELRVTMERIGTIEQEIDRAESSKASSQARITNLREALAQLPETIVTSTTTGFPNVAADAMRQRLYDLQLREQDLASKYNDDSRQMQEIRRQIVEAQDLLAQETPLRTQTTTGVNGARQGTENSLLTEQANIIAREGEIATLKKRLADARARMTSLNETATQIRRLQREIEIQEANYRKYADNLEQARIDQALDAERISNIAIVQPATASSQPVRPNGPMQLMLGILFGCFGSVVLAFACEYLDHTIRTPREVVQKLRLPALAYVPHARAGVIRPVRRRSRFAEHLIPSAVPEPVSWDIPAAVRDHYQALAHHLTQGAEGSTRAEPRVLALASSSRGEGVSEVAANLAAALSREANGPVLLVDANLANPSLHRIFDMEPSSGWANLPGNSDGCAELIRPSPVENLSLLPAGTLDDDSRECFKPDEWAAAMRKLKRDYRYVVVDLPAINEAKWTVRAASLCDGVGLVVEAERSRWEAILEAKQQLLMSHANILGVILNKRRFPVPRWLYENL
ncbi:MAG: polysaccharide biosynthesis tyrosine autokinase [Phycisphaerales bacterium]